MKKTDVVTISLPLEMLEALHAYQQDRQIGKSAAIREVLEMGLACLRDKEG